MILLPPSGLYVITSAAICVAEQVLLQSVTQAIDGGAVLVQYRDKLNNVATRERYAQQLQLLCCARGVPLILNDGPAQTVAAKGYDGMHLGIEDGSVAQARRLCPQALIGATCGQSLARAQQAQAEGASYVAFGAFYPSTTKPKAVLVSLDTLSAARQHLRLPICAIGGITPHNAAPLIEAGAHYIAVVEGVFGASDITAAASAYARLFRR